MLNWITQIPMMTERVVTLQKATVPLPSPFLSSPNQREPFPNVSTVNYSACSRISSFIWHDFVVVVVNHAQES